MKTDPHPREARLAEKQKLDGELTAARTQLAKLRAERDAMAIAQRKGELIKRYDAKLQLGFLLTGLRQRMMTFTHSLPPRLLGQGEHAIGRIIDQEVRSALKDIAAWPDRMTNPNWVENIDEDLRPAPEAGANGGVDATEAAQRERRNAGRRANYAAAKEG